MFRAVPTPAAVSSPEEMPLRIGVERGMIATLSAAGPLFALLSLPGFISDRQTDSSPSIVVSLILALVMIGAIPLALARRGRPGYVWLGVATCAYVCLIALEPFALRTLPPGDSTPWLVVLSCLAFSCLAVGTLRPVRAGVCSVVIAGALAIVHTGRLPASDLVANSIGLAVLATGLIAGVTALRIRADLADTAERRAEELFESSRRQAALEAERARTDALLHDSVLAALSTAAAGYDTPNSTVLMARAALDIVSDTADRPEIPGATVTFGHALAAAELELAPMQGLVHLDLVAASAVQLPIGVAEALVSATVQALSNSIKHAGCSADRFATATPIPGGGLKIWVSDNGCGFTMSQVAPERLGVRVSILERVNLVGATAAVRSELGSGTTVVIEWRPTGQETPASVPVGVLS